MIVTSEGKVVTSKVIVTSEGVVTSEEIVTSAVRGYSELQSLILQLPAPSQFPQFPKLP